VANSARVERVTLIEAAVEAEVPEFYGPLYPLFDASDNTNACWGPFAFVCMPPIARALAVVAHALGRKSESLSHCERALELVKRTGADAHRAWIHLTQAWITGEAEHLERALELGERLAMPALLERARALTHTARPAADNSQAARGVGALVNEPAMFTLRYDRAHEHWTLARGGRTFQLKNVRGLGMLAQLVEQPGREIHAIDLASEGAPEIDGAAGIDLGDAGEVLDHKARGAYRQRIESLREELAEAEAWRDGGRAERIRTELEALTQQIASAVGIGGRERRSGSAAERARTLVQRRIREAIKRIADHDGDLGRHLDWAVRTGTFCAYEPAGRKTGR
jgi:hypothetical protein